MDDWKSFIKIYGFIMGITAIVAYIGNETLLIIYAIIVLIGVIWMSIGGGRGRGDGGMDGHNY
jgi:hypothetical protein